jgi:hypothetical protein
VDWRYRKQWRVKGYLRDAEWMSNLEMPMRPLRTRLQEIAISGDGWLGVRGAGKEWLYFQLSMPGVFLDPSPGRVPPPGEIRTFTHVRLPTQPGFSLREARWPDGRCAWLDDRGLLHLRYANRALPEMTIVLGLGPLTAWCFGFQYGDRFYVGDGASSDLTEFWRRIRAFTLPS